MTKNLYNIHTEKYLDLIERFMFYLTTHKSDLELPQKANIVIFDVDDKNFSTYSLRVLKNLKDRREKNIVEVTRTGSKVLPWKVSRAIY